MRPFILATLMLSLLSCFGSSDVTPLKVGGALPAVTVLDHEGKSVELAKVGAQGLLLVYFYPKADTPGCTKQGCSLRDSWGELQAKGVTVFGVSTDKPDSQKAFREKYNLPFRLLADADKRVLAGFGLSSTLGFAPRTAYLFENGKCIWIDTKSSTTDQAAVVLEFLASRGK